MGRQGTPGLRVRFDPAYVAFDPNRDFLIP